MIKLKKLTENTKFWSAVVLDEESRNHLINEFRSQIPQGWEIIAHHMTINFRGLSDEEGKLVNLKVTEVGMDDKALAVKVVGYNKPTNNAFPQGTFV